MQPKQPTIAAHNEETGVDSLSSSELEYEQQSVNNILDETKNNIRKATDEFRRQIPHSTHAVNEFQEQTIQASREIADNYIDSQKEIFNSLQSTLLPQLEETNRVFTASWVSPRTMTEYYSHLVSAIADNTIIESRLVNNIIYASIEAFKTYLRNTKHNAEDFYRLGINLARIFEKTTHSGNLK
jgi:hypothetical protein